MVKETDRDMFDFLAGIKCVKLKTIKCEMENKNRKFFFFTLVKKK